MTQVHVRAVSTDGTSFSQIRRTGPLGVCGFSALPADRYRVSATGFETVEVEVAGDSREVELRSL